ncbi:class A beta-lactamase-related serine hydrolase [Fibrisoma montanum]|uniref:Class A beta-lactamase-related serine hydrolase n=1 Tax=Fibrisoma montanum TaxID=2305895 RepID=A0A418MJ39_9BACT|nr:serine hydrolase domain-containing protein [Fibrisoma montanum]RIV27417.1 class A beta-lactamase-related serine hydrolase [Fibrisoma montanum]
MKLFLSLLSIWALVGCTEKAISPDRGSTLDAEIERVAKASIVFSQAPGMAIGVLKNGQTTFYSVGVQNLSTGKPFDEYTIGEIGSISKTMTAILAAELVNQNRLSLSAPANQYLPASLQIPAKDGKEVTVLHLLNHTSGLVTDPDDIPISPNKLAQPFAEYSESRLAAFLKRTSLKSVPGSTWVYSNIGMALAGIIVRQLAGERITKLYDDRIFGPLGMTMSYTNLAKAPASNVAQGYMGRKPFDYWTLAEPYESVGYIKSNVHDMLTYLKFLTNPPRNALGEALNLTKKPTFLIKQGDQSVNGHPYHDLSAGLAWGIVLNGKNESIYNHSGGTYGFSSFMCFNEQQKTGVIIIANAGITPELSTIGLQILHLVETY